MCGAALPTPRAAVDRPAPVAKPPVAASRTPPEKPAPPVTAARSAGGSSVLGLANEPSGYTDVSYLLEDEPTPSHWRRYVILIVVIAAVGASGWYWRQDLRSWISELSVGSSASSTEAASPPPATSTPSAQASPAQSPSPPIEKPKTEGGDQSAATQTQAPPPASSESATAASAPPPAPSSAVPPATPPTTTPESTQPAPAAQPSSQSPQPENAGAPQPAPVAPAPSAPARPPSPAVMKPSSPAVEPTSPAAEADGLEAQGEKYLYGNGVPQNCARAQKSLLAAATRSNAKAQSVLGTMYATGHCATRDLPAAYRWFARALHQDPGNTRIEEDLKVLWGQMTPAERQTALQGEQ